MKKHISLALVVVSAALVGCPMGGEGDDAIVVQYCRGDATGCEAPTCYDGARDVQDSASALFSKGWHYQGVVAANGINCRLVLFRR